MSYAAQLYLCTVMNLARARRGRPPLRLSAELLHIAQRRSAEIVYVSGGLSHQGAGIPDMYWGEILGDVSGVRGMAAANYVVRLWLGSPRHREVLLGRWTYIGGGVTVSQGRTWFAGVVGHR